MMTWRNPVNLSRRAALAVCCMLFVGGFLFGHAWQSAKVADAYNEVASLRIHQQIAFRVLEVDDSITPNLALVSTTVAGVIKQRSQLLADQLNTVYSILDAGKTQIKAFRVELEVIEQEARQKLQGDYLKDAQSTLQGGRRRLDLVESTYAQLDDELRDKVGPRPPGQVDLRRDKQLETATKKAFDRITEELNRMIQEDMQKNRPGRLNPR